MSGTQRGSLNMLLSWHCIAVCVVEKQEEEEEEEEEWDEGEGKEEEDDEEEEESSEDPWEEFPEDEVTEDLGWGEGWGRGEGEDEVESRLHKNVAASEELGVDSGRWSLSVSRAGEGDTGEGHNSEAPKPGGMKLGGSLKLGSGRPRTKEGGKVDSSDENKDRERSVRKDYGSARATLSEADRVRLEEQAAWSREPDFFADMTPSVAKKSLPTSATKFSMETERTKSSLQYQSTGTEEVREEEGASLSP